MLADKILAAVEADVPVLIWGKPGIGKTETTEAVADHLGWHCETVMANLHEPPYFSGYPFQDGGKVQLSKPELIEDLENVDKGILFLDEISTAQRPTVNVLLRLIHKRKVGKYALNDGIRIIGASNFADVAGNAILSTAVANRFLHIFHEPAIQEWIDSDSSEVEVTFKAPKNWQSRIPEFKALMFTFIDAHHIYFNNFPETIETERDYAYSTPRSCMMLAKLLAVASEDPTLQEEFAYGSIGKEAGKKLMTFMKKMEKNPLFRSIDLDNFKFPDDPSMTLSLLLSATMFAKEEQWAKKAIRLFNMAYEQGFKPAAFANVFAMAANARPHLGDDDLVNAIPFIGEAIDIRNKRGKKRA